MGNTVLVTGATGFVGKVVLEELFRNRPDMPFEKVIILVRPKAPKPALERFLGLADKSPCFQYLQTSWINDVHVASGDLAEDYCGLSPSDAEEITSSTTHIIHCAASISFEAPAKVLLRENVQSSLNLLNLARQCAKLRHIVLTSTAYVTPWTDQPIKESLVTLPMPAAQLCEQLRSGALGESEALKLTGHPNMYTLTKCLCEHLVSEHRNGLPLSIVRPSIVSASWQYPMPGWIDSFAGYTGLMTGMWMGVIRVIWADRQARYDIVPVDHVAMCLIETVFNSNAITSNTEPPRVIHATSGLKNCMTGPSTIAMTTSGRLPSYPSMKPNVCYFGLSPVLFHVQDFVHQILPIQIFKGWAMLRGDAQRVRQLTKARKMQTSCNVMFQHFGTHTYDFQSSYLTLDPDFEVLEYMERVFKGASRYLLKLPVEIESEKLGYSSSEPESP